MSPDDRSSEEEERPRIRVTDRRLFDRDGNLRVPVEEQDEAPEEARSATPQAPDAGAAGAASSPGGGVDRTRGATDAGGGSSVGDAAVHTPDDAERRSARRAFDAASAEAATARDMPRDFAGFVESQYYETLLFLGAIRHPQTGQVIEDLDMARYKIDLLAMLQEKTEGNRTPEESKLLDDVLYQLRMLYLQKSKVVKL